MADWVAAGADVHFEITLSGYNADGRSAHVLMEYTVTTLTGLAPSP